MGFRLPIDLDGNLDLVKTNFAGDTPSLYHNLGEPLLKTQLSRRAWARTRSSWLGCGFFDFDNDGCPTF